MVDSGGGGDGEEDNAESVERDLEVLIVPVGLMDQTTSY